MKNKNATRETIAEPSRNLSGSVAEPCGTFPAKEILKKTIAEPCGTLRNPAEPCGIFAESSQQGKSLRKPQRNLAEPSRNLGGTFLAAEPASWLRNQAGRAHRSAGAPREPAANCGSGFRRKATSQDPLAWQALLGNKGTICILNISTNSNTVFYSMNCQIRRLPMNCQSFEFY